MPRTSFSKKKGYKIIKLNITFYIIITHCDGDKWQQTSRIKIISTGESAILIISYILLHLW